MLKCMFKSSTKYVHIIRVSSGLCTNGLFSTLDVLVCNKRVYVEGTKTNMIKKPFVFGKTRILSEEFYSLLYFYEVFSSM